MELSDQETKDQNPMDLFPGTSPMEEKVSQLVDGAINADTFQPTLTPVQSTEDSSHTQTFIIHIGGDSHDSGGQKQCSSAGQGEHSSGKEDSEACGVQIALPSGVACDQDFILSPGETLAGLQQLADGQCSTGSFLQDSNAAGTDNIDLVSSQGHSRQDDSLATSACSVAGKTHTVTRLGTCKVENVDQSGSDKPGVGHNENGSTTNGITSSQSTTTSYQKSQSATSKTVQPGVVQKTVFSPLNTTDSPSVHPVILVPVQEGPVFRPVSDILSGDHAAAENDNNLNMLHASQNANNAGSNMVVVQNLNTVGLSQSPQTASANSTAGRSLLRQTCTYSNTSTATCAQETVASEPMHIASQDCRGNLIIIHPSSSSTPSQSTFVESNLCTADTGNQKDTVLPSILFQVLTEDGTMKNINLKPDQVAQLATSSTVEKKMVPEPHKPREDLIRYRCDLCNATFNRLGNYTRHRMIHTVNTKDDYRYKCEVCDRMFLQRCDMKRHMLIHTGAYPFRCEVCSKGYIRHSDLVVHMRFHNKERAFKCDHCSKAFFQSGDLNRHVRLVHLGAKQLTCGHCNRKYSKEATLIRHMQTSHRDIILRSLGDQITPVARQQSGGTSEAAETPETPTHDIEAEQGNNCNIVEMAKTKESMTVNLQPNQ